MKSIKLNIQYFAEGAVSVETINLDQIASTINSVATNCMELLNGVSGQLKSIQNYDAQLKEVFGDNADIITSTATTFGNSLDGLSKLATEVSSAFGEVYPKYVTEFKTWGETFKSSFGTLQDAYTGAGVEKGSYSAASYAKDMANSGLVLSQAAVTAAKEVTSMGANTMKFLKSSTGYSAQDIVKNSVGTFKTLTDNTSLDSSVLGRIGNAVGGVGENLITLMRVIAS